MYREFPNPLSLSSISLLALRRPPSLWTSLGPEQTEWSVAPWEAEECANKKTLKRGCQNTSFGVQEI